MRNITALLLLLVLPITGWSVDLEDFTDRVNSATASDATQPPPKGQIVAAGSSTIKIWQSITTDLAPQTVINRGIGGFTAEALHHYADRLILRYEPRSVLIYVGDNDLAANYTPAEVLSWYRKIVARIHAGNKNAVIYVVSVKPSIARWNLWPKSKELNVLLAEWAGTDRRLVYVDAASKMLASDGSPRAELFSSDHLHLSPNGYKVWAQAIRPVVMDFEARRAPKIHNQM